MIYMYGKEFAEYLYRQPKPYDGTYGKDRRDGETEASYAFRKLLEHEREYWELFE
jgi:antitoxin component YwqK of YwqJK toxin-antitoxin module